MGSIWKFDIGKPTSSTKQIHMIFGVFSINGVLNSKWNQTNEIELDWDAIKQWVNYDANP